MRRLILAGLVASMVSSTAWAQDPGSSGAPPPTQGGQKGRIGAGVLVGLPIGDWGDLVNFSLGAVADGDYLVTPVLSVTGRVGFLYHLDDADGATFWTLPIWAGAKYYFGSGGTRPFAAGELGFNYSHASVEVFGETVSDSSLDLGINLGGGVEFGAISVRGQLTIFDLGNAGDSMELIASAAYYFAAF